MSLIELLGPVVLASVLGSLHCAGMCGPIVAFYSGGDGSHGARRWLGHVAYHGGRGAAYATLGAVAGAIGAAVDFAGAAAGVGRIAVVVAGAVMILWGVAMMLEAGGWEIPHAAMPKALQDRIAQLLRALRSKPPVARALLIGLATALMPCGWLYAFAVMAAGTGEVVGGALVMTAFWLGTVPVLLGIGVGVQALLGRFRRHVPIVAAVVLVVVGMYSVLGRLNIPSFAARQATDAMGGAVADPAGHDASSCH
jgi:sulfite exporter TauE/SafE